MERLCEQSVWKVPPEGPAPRQDLKWFLLAPDFFGRPQYFQHQNVGVNKWPLWRQTPSKRPQQLSDHRSSHHHVAEAFQMGGRRMASLRDGITSCFWAS